MSAMFYEEEIVFDEDGDLDLIVGEEVEVGNVMKMRASSRHLSLASPVFRAMLRQNGYTEGHRLQKDGHVEISLPDDNAEALAIILHIIHLRHHSIPKDMDVADLLAMCVIVDKYQIHLETLKVYTDQWTRTALDLARCDDWQAWIVVAWVLELDELFRELTRKVIITRTCDLKLDFIDVILFPTSVAERINDERHIFLNKMFSVIENVVDDLVTPCRTCDNPARNVQSRAMCEALTLGGLLQGASRKELYPAHWAPHDDLSVVNLANDLCALKLVSLCDLEDSGVSDSSTASAHGVKEIITGKVLAVMDDITGLRLSRFKVRPLPPSLMGVTRNGKAQSGKLESKTW